MSVLCSQFFSLTSLMLGYCIVYVSYVISTSFVSFVKLVPVSLHLLIVFVSQSRLAGCMFCQPRNSD